MTRGVGCGGGGGIGRGLGFRVLGLGFRVPVRKQGAEGRCSGTSAGRRRPEEKVGDVVMFGTPCLRDAYMLWIPHFTVYKLSSSELLRESLQSGHMTSGSEVSVQEGLVNMVPCGHFTWTLLAKNEPRARM